MDEGRERGEIVVNPAILGPNRRPAHITTFTIRDASGEVCYIASTAADAHLYLGSKHEN